MQISFWPRRYAYFDSLPLGIVVFDSRSRVRFWNRKMEEWSGEEWNDSSRSSCPNFLLWTKEPFFVALSNSLRTQGRNAEAEIQSQEVFRSLSKRKSAFQVYLKLLQGSWKKNWTVLSVVEATHHTLEPHRLDDEKQITNAPILKPHTVQTQLSIALAEKEFLIREIHHRIKNNLNMIAGMISLKIDALEGTTGLREPLTDLQQRIFAISQIHDLLYKSSELRLSSTGEYLKPLADIIVNTLCENPHLTLETQFDRQVNINMDATILLGLMQTELLTNALKYAFSSLQPGFVRITLERRETMGVYTLCHTGDTLPADFHPDKNTGLGMLLLKIYSSQLKGSFSWKKSDPTVFTIEFPI